MLVWIKNEYEYPIDIQFSPEEETKSLDMLKLVAQQGKSVDVIKLFTEMYAKYQYYEPRWEAEQRYMEMLRSNTTTKKIQQDNTEIEITVIDTENVPDEILQLEEQYPYLKDFRENTTDNTEYPSIPEIDFSQIPVDDEVKSLIKEYNRWYHEEYILSQGYQPEGKDFKVYCTFYDLQLVNDAVTLAEQTEQTQFNYVIMGGDTVTMSLDDAKAIAKEAAQYANKIFLRKVYLRQKYIVPAQNFEQLMEYFDKVLTVTDDEIEQYFNNQ